MGASLFLISVRSQSKLWLLLSELEDNGECEV